MMEKLNVKKFLSYVVVGGGATVVEWVMYWIFTNVCSIEYLIATILAIVISTFSNWLFGRMLTFRDAEVNNIFKELVQVYLVSVVGLLLNLLIMWLLHGVLGIWDMFAKVIATGLVFLYNYVIRIKFIYKKQN